MIIDFHTHIFPEKIAAKTLDLLSVKSNEPYFSGGTAEALQEVMSQAQVDLSIALPVVTATRQFESINGFAAQVNQTCYNEDTHTGILSFGGIHPDSEDYKGELRRIRDMGFAGIKLHPVYQRVAFDDIRYMRLVDYASELGLCMVVHAGYDVGFPGESFVSPAVSRRLIDTVHPEKLVLAHMGGYDEWKEVAQELAGQNVYLDTSFSLGKMPDEEFMQLVRLHGADKVLFASDCPWMDQKEQVARFEALPLNPEEREQIAWKNASALLGFEKV